MLQLVEYFDIDETSLSVKLFNKVAEPILNVVFCREFEQGLTYLVTKVDHLPAQSVLRHLDSRC